MVLCGAINPHSAKLIYSNFQPLEVVSRYRDPQLQVAENYSHLYLQILMFRHTLFPIFQWFAWLIKQIKTRDQQDKGVLLLLLLPWYQSLWPFNTKVFILLFLNFSLQ